MPESVGQACLLEWRAVEVHKQACKGCREVLEQNGPLTSTCAEGRQLIGALAACIERAQPVQNSPRGAPSRLD